MTKITRRQAMQAGLVVAGSAAASSLISRTQFAEADVVDLTPIEDAWVNKNQPTQNNGLTTPLQVRAGTFEKWSIYKFNVNAPSGQSILSAKVVVKIHTTGSGTLDLYRTTNSWNETGINWNNKPALGTLMDSKPLPAVAGDVVELTIADPMEGTQSFYILTNVSAAEVKIYSREAATLSRPKLTLVTFTSNDYGFPSYATLMARANKINMATVHGAETTTEITYGTGVGDFVTFNAEGWKGRPNGGKNGLTWFPSHAYIVGDMVEPRTANGFCYKVTTGGTSGTTDPAWPTTVGNSVTANGVTYKNVGAVTASNPTAFNIGSAGPIAGVRQIAFLGSTPATPAASVGLVDGLDWNNTQELFPLDAYRWSWADRKGLANGSDPNGTWTGPNLDEHALRIHAKVESDGSWATIVDGMAFKGLNDAVGIISEGGARTIFRNCLFMDVGDDSFECDYNNNSVECYDCAFLGIYTIFSTTGGRNASAEQTLLKKCVAVFNPLPWKKTTTSSICPSVGLRDNTGVDGWYWAHGVIYKQPGPNCPRFRMEDTELFIPGYSQACRSGTGLSGGTFASASGTTLRFGRGKAVTAGNGAAIPAAGIPLEDWDTAAAYMPTGVTITNDSTSGYETAVDAALQAWIDGTNGHNPHPQFADLIG